jgi:hypothetical protein
MTVKGFARSQWQKFSGGQTGSDKKALKPQVPMAHKVIALLIQQLLQADKLAAPDCGDFLLNFPPSNWTTMNRSLNLFKFNYQHQLPAAFMLRMTA